MPPKKSNTGLIVGLVAGFVVLLLLAGGGYAAWRFGLFGGSGGGTAAGGGEHGVIKELCGSFDHKPFEEVAGEKVEVWDEEYEATSKEQKQEGLDDVFPEASRCKLGPVSQDPETIGGAVSGDYSVWADWFVAKEGAERRFDSAKQTYEEMGTGYEVTDATVDGTDEAFGVTVTKEGKVNLYTLSTRSELTTVTVDIDLSERGDVESAEQAARKVVEEVYAASAKLA